ncbi:hypothetical protein JYT74_03550 [Crocinitomix catalasitica]|nr:hypothetical protein [Crocinitomix catalasitica]
MRIRVTLVFLLLFMLLLAVSSAYGQNHNNFWYFGNQQALDFSSGNPVAVNNSQMLSIEANSSYSNPRTGELLLYTNGQAIWNAKHDTMPNARGLWGHQSATQGTIVCPLPGSANLIYVFHIDRNGFAANHNGSLNYSIVDMRLDEGRGDIIDGSKNLELMAESTEKVTIIQHTNQCGFWVIAHKRNSNEFRAHLLTDLGISVTVISKVGSNHRADSLTATIGEMTASLAGDQIALLIHQQELIELFKFDSETGIVSNPLTLDGKYHDYGIEFSPDGKLLYVSNFASESSLRQYCISDWNRVQTDTSEIILGFCRKDELKFGGLQLGPDSVLYLKRSTGENFPDSLAAILKPDVAGEGCTFVKNYMHLPLNHGAHAYGPELNFSNLISGRALPLNIGCFESQGSIHSEVEEKSTKLVANRTEKK